MAHFVYTLTILLPFLGFLGGSACIKKGYDRLSQTLTCFCMGLATLGAAKIFYDMALKGNTADLVLAPWFDVKNFQTHWGLYFDTLTAVMVGVVILISFLVHLYSIVYMKNDPSIPRFMAYLSFFTFMMLVLVTSRDFLQLFFGWEGVGVASYLLIGFWYEKASAGTAALKAFVVNRVGDLGLILAMGAVYVLFGTLEFKEVFSLLSSKSELTFSWGNVSFPCFEVIGFLLFMGAMGKSAQIGLHIWLPDAMEGPTPVSALIHAATMVTAGVFLVARCSPLYQYAPMASHFMVFVGATTAFFAGTIALVQNDIKRVIAYSTCSQLGYMFIAAGLSAYHAALFHLVTHAFFKALLFLGAGAVIHAMSDEQDMRAMGGLGRFIPTTCAMMVVGSLALTGIPYFSGYYSKDAILETAWSSWMASSSLDPHTSLYVDGFSLFSLPAMNIWVPAYGYILGLISVILTAFYTWRLLCLTFSGKSRASDLVMSHIHEAPFVMLFPVFVLAIGAIFVGYGTVTLFMNPLFWKGALTLKAVTPGASEQTHEAFVFFGIPVQSFPALLAGSGMVITWVVYTWGTTWPEVMSRTCKTLYDFLCHKWYVDVFYDRYLVSPVLRLGTFLSEKFDRGVIDRFGPDGVSGSILSSSQTLSRFHTGYLAHYTYGMIVGVLLIVLVLGVTMFSPTLFVAPEN